MQKQKYIKMKLLDLKYIVSFAGMFFLIFVFSARSSHASTVTWTGNTSAVWSIGTNWDSGSAPLAGDDVVINGGNNQPTIDLSGGTTTINSLTIGSSVSSTLTFSNGDFSTKKMVVTGSVVVGANGRITHTANAGSQAHVVFLEIGGDLSIASGGAINVDAKGFASASGTGAGGNNGEATGGGYGGSGGIGWTASGGSAYGSITQPADIGSGGGNSGGTPGGAGGGAVKIVVSGTTTVSGTISANGGAGGIFAAGGSGGSVNITTGILTGTNGTISAYGGTANDYNAHVAGGGGGGRIAVYYTTDSSTNLSYQNYGGRPGGAVDHAGGAGTTFKKSAVQPNGDLIIDNNNQDNWDDRFIGRTLLNNSFTFDGITLQNYGNLATGSSSNIVYSTLTWSTKGIITDNGGTFAVVSGGGSLTVPATARLLGNTARTFTGVTVNGTLTTSSNNTTETYKLDYTVNGDFSVAVGGAINADSRGYAAANGTGAGGNNGQATGGGHGGSGGIGWTASGGGVYDSVTQPLNIGSGGGSSGNGSGGAGGGAVKIVVSGTTTVSGTISANGGAGGIFAAGGSGGSVNITTGILTGTNGTISAYGGTANDYNGNVAGGGGGGRIAVYYTTDSSTNLSYQNYGGRPGGAVDHFGGAGTTFKKSAVQLNGDLIIDNNNQDSWDDRYIGRTLINAAGTFDGITLQNYGNLATGSSSNIVYSTLTWSTKGIITDNGGTFAVVSGGGSLTVPATARLLGNTARTFTGLTVNGTLTHSNNLTAETYRINYIVNGDLAVASGGLINTDYKGYQASEGTGQGTDGNTAGGGGYGGAGGAGTVGAGGSSYGSAINPNNIGSGGGNNGSNSGASGGGAVIVTVSGTANIVGTISANGAAGVSNAGAGSGGTVNIASQTLIGNGTITANGGNSGGGGGGGGRIYITYFSSTASLTNSVSGGTGVHNGTVGTIRTGSLSGSLISSPYDSGSDSNAVSKIQWAETLPAGTDAKFQVRTAPNNAGAPGAWTDWMGPTGTSDYFTDPSGGETMNSTFKGGNNDRWFEYKVFLTSNDLSAAPSVSSVTVVYVVNSPPQFDPSFGTNGVSISQVSDSGDANWGKMKIQYAIEDPDATSGTVTKDYITPTFEYTLDGGNNWLDVNLANVTFGAAPAGGGIADRNSDGTLENKVLEGGFLTYVAYWNAKTQIPETYSNDVQIRVSITDNELANSNAQAIGKTTALDVKTPAVGAHPLLVDATTAPATVTLSSTDDSTLKMNVNLTNTFPSALSTAYASSTTVPLLTNPDTVYAEFQDIFGNTTPVYSAATPETPTAVMIQDTSNMLVTPHEYRLFTAWKIADPATPVFAHYNVYRSTSSGGTYDLIGTSDVRAANYYGDSSAVYNQHYFYKIATQDADGNISCYSSSADGKADGIQDEGEGGGGTLPDSPPVISNVASSHLDTTQATITWDTDELSNSEVGYSTTSGNFGTAATNNSYVNNDGSVGKHSVVLTGLAPDTTYYFETISSDASGNETTDDNGGPGYSFATDPGPAISGVLVNEVDNNEVKVAWKTDVASDSKIIYSDQADLSNPVTVEDSEALTVHELTLSGLDAEKKYYFLVKSEDSENQIATDDNGGAYYAFTTALDESDPVISAVTVPLVSQDKAVITWTTDEPSTSQASYGKTHILSSASAVNTILGESHSVILTDLDPETDYFFKVKSIDINGNETEDAELSFTTLKDTEYQHDPLTVIINVSDPPSVVTDTKAVITWDTDQPANSTVEYGTISGNYNEVPVVDDSLDMHHSVALSSLLYQTTYYFKVSSEDNLGNAVGSIEYSFTTLPKQVDDTSGGGSETSAAPHISNIKKSKITANSVTITWSTDKVTDGKIRYGLDDKYGQAAAEDITASDVAEYDTSHEIIMTGLLANTSYHFSVVSTDADGNIGTSGDNTFSTSAIAALSGLSVTNITLNSAVVNWETANPTSSVVDYGLTTTYGKTASNAASTNTHKLELANLSPAQTYHLRVNGINKKDATASIVSDDYVFATYAPPKLENYNVQEVTDNFAKLIWKTNIPTDSLVQYVNKSSGESGTQGVPEPTADHELAVSNLKPGTEYELKITGTDVNKNSFTSNPFTLTTAQDAVPPQVSQVKTESSLAGGKEDKVQSIIFWKTDEPSSSQVRFEEGIRAGDSFSQESKEDGNLTTNHIIVLTNLKLGTVYHFMVVSKDASGNETVSDNFTLLTPQKTQSIIQLIIANFEQTFGWIRKVGD